MKITREEYILLYEKCLAGKCSEDERKILEEHEDDFNLTDNEWDEKLMGPKDGARQQTQAFLDEKIRVFDRFKVRPVAARLAAAAVILLVISTSLYFFVLKKPSHQITAATTRFENDVRPGSSKALLTLDNGEEIVLESAAKGLVAKQGNVAVEKDGDGQLIYKISANESANAASRYNTVSTPPGGEYQVILPDGTKVWLNAASSLRFPTIFSVGSRTVELSGEAYFEVKENKKKPFIVSLPKNVEVKVLGTHFNIMAYADENRINTTLLEGAVEVKQGSAQELLKPGQQAVFSKETNDMKVEKVNVENVVAWKNGYFIFRNEDLRNIMRQISRWYDVEVVFEGNLGNKNFMGTISRTKNISELLNILELTESVHFKVEGRKITVIP